MIRPKVVHLKRSESWEPLAGFGTFGTEIIQTETETYSYPVRGLRLCPPLSEDYSIRRLDEVTAVSCLRMPRQADQGRR